MDFFWINRDQKSFEWFVKLLSQLEIEQAEHGGAMSRSVQLSWAVIIRAANDPSALRIYANLTNLRAPCIGVPISCLLIMR